MNQEDPAVAPGDTRSAEGLGRVDRTGLTRLPPHGAVMSATLGTVFSKSKPKLLCESLSISILKGTAGYSPGASA